MERHGLTGSEVQTEFNFWTAAPLSYRLTKVSGSEISGERRYTVIFEKTSKTTGWTAQAGMNAADFTAQHNSLHASGHRLIWLDGFAVGSTPYYCGIWEQNGGPTQRVRLGESLANHQSASATNQAAGFSISDVSAFSLNGTAQYAGVWASGTAADIQVRYALSAAGYQSAFNSMGSSGYSLWRVSGADVGGSAQYTGVWRKTSLGEGWAIHGMSEFGFTAENTNAAHLGYRPAFVEPFRIGSATFFNAVWVRNGGLSTSRLTTINNAVQNYMTTQQLPGLSLAIAHEGELVYAKGFGYADTASGEQAHAEHRWRIASTSKPVCATAALRALEDSPTWSLDSRCFGSGALFANDYGDVGDHPYSTSEKAITVRQLLNMTAGWNTEGKLWYNDQTSYGSDHAQIIGYQLDSLNPFWTPGAHYRYNNFNYQVAARIPEKISGLSFLNYTRQQVFTPCGMKSPALGNRTAAGKLSGEVSYYTGDIYGSPENVWPARMDGSTAWVMQPSDLLLMGRRIDGSPRQADILGSYAISQMRLASNAPDDNGNASGYGLGWYPSSGYSHTWWQHNGSMGGTQALLCVSDDGTQSFAYAANSVRNSDAFSSSFRSLVLGLMNDLETANAWPAIDLSGTWNAAYDAWAATAFGAMITGTDRMGLIEVWAPGADPDNDGRSNLFEAFLGSDPLEPDKNSTWATASVTSTDLVLRWTRKKGDRGIVPVPEWSSDLKTWSTTGGSVEDRNDVITILGNVVQEAKVPRNGAKKKYLRLRLGAP